MTHVLQNQALELGVAPLVVASETSNGRSLYKFGGAAALVAVCVILLDIFISFVSAGVIPEPGSGTVIDWFTLFQSNRFLGLYGLGILNIAYSTLTVCLFVALCAAIRREAAYLAAVILCIGTTIYIANNSALAMLDLSAQYTAASSDAQRSLIAAAGQALLAQAEDFTPGAFMGFFFLEVAGMMMSLVIFQSRIFSKTTAWAGIFGFVLLFASTTWATFIPSFYGVTVGIAIVGGLLNLVWYVLVARGLFRMNRLSEKA